MLFPDSVTQIIMVSYFRPNDFLQSVRSVLFNTTCPFHLSIIDNSHGGLDAELDILEVDPRITTYRNKKNYGKGVAFNMRFSQIMAKCEVPYFISIDGDIEVFSGWLSDLKTAYQAVAHNEKPGIIAPAIMLWSSSTRNSPVRCTPTGPYSLMMDRFSDTFEKQMRTDKFTMHNKGKFEQVRYHQGLYKNRYLAGPLFMVDHKFFNSVGGYYEGQLYGADDGRLCKGASKQNRFLGIDSNVQILHLNKDTTDEYDEWKIRNVTKDVDHKGHWDQSDNQSSADR